MINSIVTLSANGGSTSGSLTSLLLSFGLVFVLFYFLLLRPQKKKEKKEAEMRNNLQIGDEVITVGGIVGIVFSVKEDTVVVETGGDRAKIRVKKWAIAQNLTIHEED